MKFICDMSTIQTYLGRKEANSGNTIVESLRKSRREERGERNDVTDIRERKRNFGNEIAKKKNLNCGNWIAKIRGLKKKKKKTELWQE